MHPAWAIPVSLGFGVVHAQQNGPAGDIVAYDFSGFNGTLNFESVVKFGTLGSDCQMEQETLKSPIAPLDQGLTAVFRGPISLKQFAVYHLQNDSEVNTKAVGASNMAFHNHKMYHAALHRRSGTKHRLYHRNCGDSVTATIDDQIVSFIDDWDCAKTSTQPTLPQATSQTTSESSTFGDETSSMLAETDITAPAPQASTAMMLESQEEYNISWKRDAYYSALQPSRSYGLTFLYPLGDGRTDFLPSTGETNGQPASSPEILGDVLIPDNSRFYIASDVPVIQSVAPQNKAYQGFRGDKIILVEMAMPLSGLRDQSPYPDQPAFWLLNEQLPNIDDASQCSCWTSGCGEFDINEIIDPGSEVGYSALHMGQQYCGGADNGFRRAVDGTQKLAVILKAGTDGPTSIIRILELDKWYVFAETIEKRDYDNWRTMPVTNGGIGRLLFGEACPDVSAVHFGKA